MTRIEAVARFLKRMSEAYIIDQQAKGMYTSGRSAKTLKEVTEPDGGKLLGKGYWHQQKVGRRPGKFPPIQAIRQWIDDKGITADIPLDTLAFLIARKIARSGTDIFQRKRPGIDITKELKEARMELAIDVSGVRKQELIDQLLKTKRQVEAAQR